MSRAEGFEEHFTLLLVYVMTGKVNDCGARHAPHLRHRSELGDGCDSVSGTESNQDVLPVRFAAKVGDEMAANLLQDGHLLGRQFTVFDPSQAYPAFVVTYRLSGN